MNGFCKHNRPLVDFICAKKIMIIWYMIYVKKQSESKILLPLHFTPFEWNWNPCKWIVIAHPLSRFVSSFQDSQLKRDSIQMWFSLWHQITFRWHVKWQCQEISKTSFKISITILAAPLRLPPLHGGTIKICSSTCGFWYHGAILNIAFFVRLPPKHKLSIHLNYYAKIKSNHRWTYLRS